MTISKSMRQVMYAILPLLIIGCSKPNEADSTEKASPEKAVQVSTEAPTASEILKKVEETYASLDTYRSKGIIKSDIDTGDIKMTVETSFSILLKKPNRYLISWEQKGVHLSAIPQFGTVWSDGTQPYLYMGITNRYSKMKSDEIALGSATGISGGAAHTVPSLFLAVLGSHSTPLARLIDPKIEKSEKFGGEDCYVITAASSVFNEESFWISKKSYLIKQFYHSMEAPEGGRELPTKMTDKQLEAIIKESGQEVTEQSVKQMREMMDNAEKMMNTNQVKGFSLETHTEISSPDLKAEDFQFTPPEGTKLKNSIFDGIQLPGSETDDKDPTKEEETSPGN